MKSNKWLYDIYLGNEIVGNQGLSRFDDEDTARKDAHDLIRTRLSSEYGREFKDFYVLCYEGSTLDN